VETHFGPFRDILISTQDRFMICAERTIGSEIILDALECTARDVDQAEAHLDPFGDNVNLNAR
jgi:hypothetical protein